ncbi:MAG: FecR family protein [Gammaproteobacteria bacterium]
MKILNRLLSIAFLTLPMLLLPAPSVMAQQNYVGEISRMRGPAFVRGVNRFELGRVGTKLRTGDRVLTGVGTRLDMTMIDGSSITLGDTTDFTVKSYDYVPADDVGRAVFSFLKGAFVAVTGGIGKVSSPDFRVQTPVATMGVRGTTFWGGLKFFDDELHLALLDGKGVFLENQAGRTEIRQVGYGARAGAGTRPTAPVLWAPSKMNAAKASVTW